MDVENDDLGPPGLLTTAGNKILDREGTENERSSGRLTLSDELDDICQLFSVDSKPSRWPFSVGNLVCFRPSKTSEWFNGKIEKIPGVYGKENQSLISLVNNPTVTYEVAYCQDMIKSNNHKIETLNKLDSDIGENSASGYRKNLERRKNSEKEEKNKKVKNSEKGKNSVNNKKGENSEKEGNNEKEENNMKGENIKNEENSEKEVGNKNGEKSEKEENNKKGENIEKGKNSGNSGNSKNKKKKKSKKDKKKKASAAANGVSISAENQLKGDCLAGSMIKTGQRSICSVQTLRGSKHR